MRSPTESRTEHAPSRTPQPVNDNGDGGLPEPPSWYLSSWELRVGLTIIEHDDIATVPGEIYSVEAQSDTDTNWTVIVTFSATDTTATVVEPRANKALYRVRVE